MKTRLRLSLLFMGLLLTTTQIAIAQQENTIRLVKDISLQPATNDKISYVTKGQDYFYYLQQTDKWGKEIWKSNGSLEGTEILVDLLPGQGSYDIHDLHFYEGTLYFFVYNYQEGYQLWSSDGTAEGTEKIKNLNEQSVSNRPEKIGMFNGHFIFKADDGTTGTQLWRSDGTDNGTYILSNINLPNRLTEVVLQDSEIYILSGSDNGGGELWKSDGTNTASTLLKTLTTTHQFKTPLGLARLGDKVVFSAPNGGNDRFLWISDGTTAGTEPISNTSIEVVLPQSFFEHNNKVYFFAGSQFGLTNPWVTDGTAEGTFAIPSGTEKSSITSTQHFIAIGDQVFFTVSNTSFGTNIYQTDGTVAGTGLVQNLGSDAMSVVYYDDQYMFYRRYVGSVAEMWISDGTSAGTQKLAPLFIGDDQNNDQNTFVQYQDDYYFFGRDANLRTEVWKTDGTPSGTEMLKDIYPDDDLITPSNIMEFKDQLLFITTDKKHGYEWWRSEGTSLSTQLVKDVYKNPSSTGVDFLAVDEENKLIYFFAKPYNVEEGIWRTDGTEEGTFLIKQVAHGYNSYPKAGAVLNGTLYFAGYDENNGIEMWKSDGTEAGTKMISNFFPDQSGIEILEMVAAGDHIFFTANTSELGRELYITDGTPAGTQLVKDIQMDEPVSNTPYGLVALNDEVFFIGFDQTVGYEIWKSDGTPEGTIPLIDIPDTHSDPPTIPHVFNNEIYFGARGNNQSYHALWKSDGTTQGTQMVKGFEVGNQQPLEGLSSNENHLFFSYDDGINGVEPWVSDGTEAGTRVLKNIATDFIDESSYPSWFAGVDDQVFFVASTGFDQSAIYVSDGTAQGTNMLSMVNEAQPGESYINDLIGYNGRVFFHANDGTHGSELWTSDGTVEGTQMLQDLNEGAEASMPTNFLSTSFGLFFTANNGENGTEIFAVSPCADFQSLSLDTIGYCGDQATIHKNDFDLHFITVLEGLPDIKSLEEVIILSGQIGETYQLSAALSYGACPVIMDTITLLLQDTYADGSPCELGVSVAELTDLGLSLQLFPNPTSQLLNVHYQLAQTATVDIQLYDFSGRLIRQLQTSSRLSPNDYQQQYDLSDLPDGMYILSVQSEHGIVSKKLVLSAR